MIEQHTVVWLVRANGRGLYDVEWSVEHLHTPAHLSGNTADTHSASSIGAGVGVCVKHNTRRELYKGGGGQKRHDRKFDRINPFIDIWVASKWKQEMRLRAVQMDLLYLNFKLSILGETYGNNLNTKRDVHWRLDVSLS